MSTPAFPRGALLTALATTTAAALLATAPAAHASRGAARCAHSLTVPTTATERADAARATACLVNVERTSRSLPALRRDKDLAKAAREHAGDMVRRAYFAHTSPTGGDLGDRIRRAGYGRPGDGWRAGENIGWGTGVKATPNALVDAWLDSPPHRKIMLSRRFKELGVGVATGAPGRSETGATYAIDFATLRPA